MVKEFNMKLKGECYEIGFESQIFKIPKGFLDDFEKGTKGIERLRILKLIETWKEENNCILTTEDIIKEKIVMADYFKWDKIKELKDLISGKGEK